MIFTRIVKKIIWEKQIRRILKKIQFLHIIKGDISEDNTPFVKLSNGLVFYGPPTQKKYEKYYNSLNNDIKKLVKRECLGILLDIVIRYQEGGLKLGGPKKEESYRVHRGNVVVEMGAYLGYYCMYLSKKVGSKGIVIAIEPIPKNLKFLEKNINENGLDNVVLVKKGVWNEHSQQTTYLKKGDMQSASIQLIGKNKEKMKIEVDKLDNILDEIGVKNVDLMIIQLNGVEYEALEGLTKIKPKNLSIASRYKKDGKPSIPLISEILKKRGYAVRIIDKAFVYAELKK